MKEVDVTTLLNAVPVQEPPKVMTRTEKLMRWAQIVRDHQSGMPPSFRQPLWIFHRLEYWNGAMLDEALSYHKPPALLSAFDLAASDAAFRAQGYEGTSVRSAMNFFDLSQAQLHEFSCDCGGAIHNDEMARRIEGLAKSA